MNIRIFFVIAASGMLAACSQNSVVVLDEITEGSLHPASARPSLAIAQAAFAPATPAAPKPPAADPGFRLPDPTRRLFSPGLAVTASPVSLPRPDQSGPPAASPPASPDGGPAAPETLSAPGVPPSNAQ